MIFEMLSFDFLFYRGERNGLYGRKFQILKLRTMVKEADQGGPFSVASNDPRVTKIGAFLRQTKLDELPQLVNILKGEMALVGPRPEVPQIVATWTDEERRIILSVKPGLTDLASLWNHREGDTLAKHSDPDGFYLSVMSKRKKQLQIQYVLNRTFWLDLKILFWTFLTLTRTHGIYKRIFDGSLLRDVQDPDL